MLYEILAQHADVIHEVTIERFRYLEAAHELRASIALRDGSVVHVRDYLFRDGTRKYAYHWQTSEGRLRRRWDNSGPWPDLPSHPHHVHVRSATNVSASPIRDLAGAMCFVAEALRRSPQQRRPAPRGRRRR
ncbi:DUF6516 family protein [Candidatus Binatia bacterium]|nr:DUF6516 family protein [Candidatus Binatia bacterium]